MHFIFVSLKTFQFPLQEDPSKAEMSKKMEIALQFPTDVDLKDLKEVEGDFGGESLFHGFVSILYDASLTSL